MKLTTASKLTLGRIVAVPVFLVCAYLDWKIPAAILYILACFTDYIDGYVARNYNQITSFGKFMDPLADKILVLAAMCFFVEMGRIPGWALALVLFREFAVSGLRLVAACQNTVIAAGWSGKIKTAVTMIGLAAMLFFEVPAIDTIVWILIVITTLFSGFEYFFKNKGVFENDSV